MRNLFSIATKLALLCIYFVCLQVPHIDAQKRRARDLNSDNELDSNLSANSNVPAQQINRDLMDKMSWKCANNASCLYALVNGVYEAYKRGETVKLGPFDLVKVSTNNSTKHKYNFAQSGRGMSSFIDFLSGNSIRVPIGPMVFSVQRAEDDSDYIEVALLKKAVNTARHQVIGKTGGGGGGGGGGLLGGSGSGGGGLLSGGMLGGSGLGGSGIGGGGGGSGLGGSGGGGGGGIGGRRRKQHHDKKQFQMYIPMYLAASTFGWTMVAAKAVGLLTLKALAISKLAFVVSAMIIVKKLMDSASEKMMYQYPEHAPYMLPYNMAEYPMQAMGGEMATSDMFQPSALQLAAAAPVQHAGHGALENYAAESHYHHNIAEAQNNTQMLAALNAVGLGQKVKREDAWIAKRYNRQDQANDESLIIAAALVTANDSAEASSHELIF